MKGPGMNRPNGFNSSLNSVLHPIENEKQKLFNKIHDGVV
jgi:hypothetical protein